MASLSGGIPVAVSAPGKVLFAGGYLVLDRQHTGLVFGLNARIHVRIDPRERSSRREISIDVHSPQFQDARWHYIWAPGASDSAATSGYQIRQDSKHTEKPNVFVAAALEYALTYHSQLGSSLNQDLEVTILADDDYYSHKGIRNRDKFTHFGTTLHEAHKTGLGSSAALVTALIAALLEISMPNGALKNREVLHNVAQAAHCAAQGKVGSGFDVAAAVYGSCLYRRFTPSILESIGDNTSPDFARKLYLCVTDQNPGLPWDMNVSKVEAKIPKSLLLLMCDVDCGSETPGMVRKVLAWRKERPHEADPLWAALQTGQDDLCRKLNYLSELNGYSVEDYAQLVDIVQNIRSLVREMSGKSGVPIEPPVITELLDYCNSLPGVIGGVAPGAGGYDAVALLVRNDVEVVRDLEDRLNSWKSNAEVGTGATIGKVSLLSVRQEYEGLRLEECHRYDEWVKMRETVKDGSIGST